MVGRIEASLAAAGFRISRDSVAGRRAVIGRRSLLGRETFVLVAVFKSDASPDHLGRFVDEAGEYAATTRGRLGGRPQVVAVAVVGAAPGTPDWTGGRGQGPTLPVLVEVGGGVVVHSGAAMPPGLATIVREHIARSVRSV